MRTDEAFKAGIDKHYPICGKLIDACRKSKLGCLAAVEECNLAVVSAIRIPSFAKRRRF